MSRRRRKYLYEPLYLQGDSTKLPIRSSSVACIVCSPPYLMGMEYDSFDDDMDPSVYRALLLRWAEEIARVLMPGGRAWVNVPPTAPHSNGERVALTAGWTYHLHKAGLFYRDTVVWQQDRHSGGTGWGSWLRPTAPNQRGEYEDILCFYKPPYKRDTPDGFEGWKSQRHDLGGDWSDLVRNVWHMPSGKKVDGVPTFPIELPARCIRLSTWPGEIVLDTFGGRGTTLLAAHHLNRRAIAVDLSHAYASDFRARLLG